MYVLVLSLLKHVPPDIMSGFASDVNKASTVKAKYTRPRLDNHKAKKATNFGLKYKAKDLSLSVVY